MALQLKLVGLLLVILALIHAFFPRHFKWKEELKSLSPINKEMMYVHSFFIAFTVLLMGTACIICTDDMLNTRLGKYLSLGLFMFWLVRLLFQFFIYSPKLWRGKTFETSMHILFSMLWLYLTVVFYLVYHLNVSI